MTLRLSLSPAGNASTPLGLCLVVWLFPGAATLSLAPGWINNTVGVEGMRDDAGFDWPNADSHLLKSVPYVSFVPFDVVLLYDSAKLALIRFLAMVVFLIFDVLNQLIDVRWRNRKGTVSGLPLKVLQRCRCFF